MFDFSVPQTPGFPMAWWLMWFIVAFLVYGLLGVWFWRAGRRHDQTTSKSDDPPAGRLN